MINKILTIISTMMMDQQVKQNPSLPDRILEAISHLPSSQHYVVLFPAPHLLTGQYSKVIKESMNPYLLVFEDQENLTHIDFAAQFIKQNGLKFQPHYLYFDELLHHVAFRHKKLSQFKRGYHLDTIDGCCFELNIFQSDIECQNGIMDMLQYDKVPKKSKTGLNFHIPQNNFHFNVPLEKLDNYKSFTTKVAGAIKKDLKVTVKPQKLKLYYYPDLKETEVTSSNMRQLVPKDCINVKFSEPVHLPKPDYKNQTNYIFFRDFTNNSIRKFTYAEIRSIPIMTIFARHLDFEKRGLEASQYGLRIHDLIIKPMEKLEDFGPLEDLFQTKSKYVKAVHALVIKQSQMFYTHIQTMGEISAKYRPSFQKIISTSQKNQSHRKECENVIKVRAKSTKHTEFRNQQQRIEPILYYTSDLQVKENNRSAKLYYALNEFLRKLQFGTVDRSQYQKWQYLFSHSLLNNLKLIKEYNGDLYRGVTHKETYKVGKIMKFKQFNSCSTNPKIAQSFASTAIYVFKNCRVGRPIKEYSFFQTEEQVLNLPYVEYEVIEVAKQKKGNQSLDIVTMKEIEAPALKFDLKDQRHLFVLWVDGDKGQGVQISHNVSQIDQTTFFIHLKSTKQLKQWLQANAKAFDDKTVGAVLITNMFREQDGVANEYAGVEAIKTFRTLHANSNILVYIGNIQAAKEKLNKHEIKIGPNLAVANTNYALSQFFNNCGVR